MRKASILAASCIALVAFLGMSAQAFAVHDPACDPYGNQFGVWELSISTPDNGYQHNVSGVTGSGLACGTDIHNVSLLKNCSSPDSGSNSQFVRADIASPPGVSINSGSAFATGQYVGSANVNVLSWLTPGCHGPLGATLMSGVNAILRAAPLGDGDCPDSDTVACYKGITDGLLINGHGWTWVTGNETNGYTLTIGEFYNDSNGTPAGLTKINNFTLCDYAGAGGSNTTCGDGSDETQWLQKNGDGSYPNCSNGNGIYSAAATTRGGSTTAAKTACVSWLSYVGQDCQTGSPRNRHICIQVRGPGRSRG